MYWVKLTCNLEPKYTFLSDMDERFVNHNDEMQESLATPSAIEYIKNVLLQKTIILSILLPYYL